MRNSRERTQCICWACRANSVLDAIVAAAHGEKGETDKTNGIDLLRRRRTRRCAPAVTILEGHLLNHPFGGPRPRLLARQRSKNMNEVLFTSGFCFRVFASSLSQSVSQLFHGPAPRSLLPGTVPVQWLLRYTSGFLLRGHKTLEMLGW